MKAQHLFAFNDKPSDTYLHSRTHYCRAHSQSLTTLYTRCRVHCNVCEKRPGNHYVYIEVEREKPRALGKMSERARESISC